MYKRQIDVFDKHGDLVEVQYRYDKKAQLSQERHLSWTGSGLTMSETFDYVRDATGRVAREARQEVREGGELYVSAIRYRYDRAGHVVWKKGEAREDDSVYTFAWDGKGRIVALSPGWGGKVALEWREKSGAPGFEGLTLHESWSDADDLPGYEPVTLRFAVDAAGRTIYERVRTSGREYVEYWTTFDDLGRELTVRESTFAPPFFEDPLSRRELRYSYDAAGRREQTEVFDVLADPVTGADVRVLITRTAHLYVGCL